jgi:hypothetical protein
VASLYAMTPETYTKYTAAGTPDFTAAAASSGVGHQTFTKKQTMAWVKILAHAAENGRVGTAGFLQQYIKTAPGLNSDLDYRPADLKYIW